MSFGFAGALMGAGDALKEWAEDKRKEAAEIASRKYDSDMLTRRERIANRAREKERGYQLEDMKLEQDREDAHALNIGNLISGNSPTAYTDSQGQPFGSSKEIIERLSGDLERELGLSKEQVAGIVGNFAHETGGFKHYQEIEPVVPGSRGGAGLAQWTGSRREDFEKWSADSGLDPKSYDANFGFFLHELKNTEEGQVLDRLREAQTAEEAAKIFSEVTLRPGQPNMASRQALAGEVLRMLSHPETTAGQRQALQLYAKQQGLFGSKGERKILKAADGFHYDADTGERVFPNVQLAPADEYGRYVQEMNDAGEIPLSRIEYSQAKKGPGFSVTTADGTVVQLGGKSENMTEAQSKDLVYATRAQGALKNLDKYGDSLTSRLQKVAELDPTGWARELQSDEYQLARQAGNEFLQAILRKDTGAAITEQEQQLYGVTYLPQPGDSAALLAQKKKSRHRAIIALKAGMNPTQILRLEMATEEDLIGGTDLLTPDDPLATQDAVGEAAWNDPPPPSAANQADDGAVTFREMPEFLSKKDRDLWPYMTPEERQAVLKTYNR